MVEWRHSITAPDGEYAEDESMGKALLKLKLGVCFINVFSLHHISIDDSAVAHSLSTRRVIHSSHRHYENTLIDR